MQSIHRTLDALERRLARSQSQRGNRSRRGMTLMEVMIVIVIILLLMGVLTFGVMNSLEQARSDATELLIGRINQQVVVYKVKKKKLPDELSDVFKTEDVPLDSWGNPFQFRKGGKAGYDIISAGPDGKPGTADDIKMSDLNN